MNTPIENYFGHILLINLARRPDRLAHSREQFLKLGITNWERFEAYDAGPTLGNHGCTGSHRLVMDLIVKRGWERCLVLEDDFEMMVPDPQEQFARMIGEVPNDWKMLYLGAGYGEKPRKRISPHVILCGEMKTTSSYGVTLESAKELFDLIPEGTGEAIDNLYAGYNKTQPCYIFQPRLFKQWFNYSDLQRAILDNGASMSDTGHENMV